jgi:hypothetical protein
MKYTAVRPFLGDEGLVRKGDVLDLDEDRAEALGALVRKGSDGGSKAAPAPLNKMEQPPSNKMEPAPQVTPTLAPPSKGKRPAKAPEV